jgi:hypothetical protein
MSSQWVSAQRRDTIAAQSVVAAGSRMDIAVGKRQETWDGNWRDGPEDRPLDGNCLG